MIESNLFLLFNSLVVIGLKSFKYSSLGWQSGKLSASSFLGLVKCLAAGREYPLRLGGIGFSLRGISWKEAIRLFVVLD